MPWYVALFWASSAVLTIASWRWAEWPEQTLAAVTLAGAVVTRLVRSPLPHRYQAIEVPILIVDLTALAIFLIVALRADRWWPLFATAMLGVSMLGHVMRVAYPGFGTSGYSVAGLATYGVPIALGIGLINTARRNAESTSPAS